MLLILLQKLKSSSSFSQTRYRDVYCVIIVLPSLGL